MPRKKPRRCRRCNLYDHECGPVSWSGLCDSCSSEAVRKHNQAIANKSGEAYERWQTACDEAAMTRAQYRHSLTD